MTDRLNDFPRLLDWESRGNYLSVDDEHDVFYIDEGEGDVILFLQNFPFSSWLWQPLWDTLSDGYRLIAFDPLGIGLSDKPISLNYRIADSARQLRAVLEHLGVDSLSVLTHGGGMNLLQEMLAQMTKNGGDGLRISKVTAFNCAMTHDSPIHPEHRRILIKRSKALVEYDRQRFCDLIHSISGPQKISSKFLDECWMLLSHNNGIDVADRVMSYVADRLEFGESWEKALKQRNIPIHYICGLADPIWGQQSISAIRRSFGEHNLHITELANVGNMPMVEKPAAVLSLLV